MASGFPSVHQRKLGPAPIASFEDLSDELENGEAASRMPGIVEVTTPVTPGSSLKTPSTPRIDISRASSSSHHEDSNNSRDSSPERELLAGAEPPPGSKLTLGYKEDVTDLRSSTEELDLQDPVHEQDLKSHSRKLARRRLKEDGTQSESGGTKVLDRERKDSNCSEIILLNISGRTSRLSSVGSQGSGVSGKLSVMSATSSRSPSPHKCLLETSFCGNKPMLADNLIEPSKPETDDLEKVLLQREADTTRALIPDSIRVPMVAGNLKPDPLDKPRRRAREDRKEIFKREVEITKRVLERVHIDVPITKKYEEPESKSSSEVQKPASLDLTDKRKKPQNFKEIVQTTPTSSGIQGSPKLPRHQKVRELEGSRTPSPSSVSRKSSFTSLFKARTDGSVLSPESPTPGGKSRRSLTSKIKDTTEGIRSRSKSRERVSTDRGSTLKKETKNKGVFSSTLSLFKKRERKKSCGDPTTPLDGDNPSLESIGNVEFTFNSERSSQQKEDSIFISLHADDRYYEVALPSESVSIPLETPTKLFDEYESEPRSGSIVTEASIEHHDSSQVKTEASIEASVHRSSSKDSQIPQSNSRESQMSKSSSKDSRISVQTTKSLLRDTKIDSVASKLEPNTTQLANGSAIEPPVKKPEIIKPKRKSKEVRKIEPSETIDDTSLKTEINGNEPPRPQVPQNSREHGFVDDEGCLKVADGLVKTPSVVSDLDHNSSESERDSEIEFIRNKAEKVAEELPDERKGLCYDESFEEDLPYVPTTLPLEKSVAVPILPVKQRLQEVRTIPIERPRSTTPINPTLLDEFVMQTSMDERRVEKMKISLPREDSFKLKSPRKQMTNTFTEFAGRVPRNAGKSPSPPPLPPRAPAARPTAWINFEEIPEKRKAPKRIQTIPRPDDEAKGGYSYVQPEECRCECHEESRRASLKESTSCTSNGERPCNGENCTGPVAATSGDRASIVSDSSLDYSLSIEEPGAQPLLGPMKPFGMDLDVRSNRSSTISQEEADDAHQ
ncbi:muscle M-line assembly protein unc-89 isoform X1 [Neodiprion fabricii]|uniref:muscle M-line assembly protein unc-89 isoform X1 n=2 Tax=Neodiprion fabricii TaxID=2872261 RepID=UPI001ED96C2C|nr:muscle M-line assembly protein unc-89 isoform X1 [Neodiprion fabricii]